MCVRAAPKGGLRNGFSSGPEIQQVLWDEAECFWGQYKGLLMGTVTK